MASSDDMAARSPSGPPLPPLSAGDHLENVCSFPSTPANVCAVSTASGGGGGDSSKYWNVVAGYYDALSASAFFAQKALDHLSGDVEKMGATCRRSAMMVDVAAGTGGCTIQASARFPQAKILATDASDAMLEVLKRKVDESGILNVDVKKMDGQGLREVEDDTVDLLTCVFGIMYFADRSRGWRAIHRVLKPGGRAAVVTWKSPGRHALLDEAMANLEDENKGIEREKGRQEEKEENDDKGGECPCPGQSEARGRVGQQPQGEYRHTDEKRGGAIEVDEGREKTENAVIGTLRSLKMSLPSPAAIASDLASAGCHFSAVEYFPTSHVWDGIAEEEIGRTVEIWGTTRDFNNTFLGCDKQLVLTKLEKAMRSRVNDKGRVAVPCEALITILTK